MSNQLISVQPWLAATPPKPHTAITAKLGSDVIWMGSSGVLFLLLLGSIIFFQLKTRSLDKQLKTELFRNKELQKKYKLAVGTIAKMEKNPDLIHSREFNLDYLRMRMAEDVFHYAIIVQIKMKVKQQISIALRPTQAAVGEQSNAGTARQVDSIFDVEYETGIAGDTKKRVLFRIQIRLMKLPTQSTSTTINEIIDCLETYLSPTDEHDNWQPTIQGRIVHIEWDQKAKPTPLLVLEQSNEGVNVTFRTTRPGGVKASHHDMDSGDLSQGRTQGKIQGKTPGKKRNKSEVTKSN
ncbi:hypothetical protein [Planktothrix sp. FACHB-1365]|uniref:hypothetical protein n=1 Tax=Planktothrix sp. FACHB-1365 TaxID=2692855 RepID=UPI001682FB94|nr:hypothetical protein [Planktothrix sp. FACHB-1365]MBD2484780.1 hypothetical protein [Planktothrix sp. FACHB-1365]